MYLPRCGNVPTEWPVKFCFRGGAAPTSAIASLKKWIVKLYFRIVSSVVRADNGRTSRLQGCLEQSAWEGGREGGGEGGRPVGGVLEAVSGLREGILGASILGTRMAMARPGDVERHRLAVARALPHRSRFLARVAPRGAIKEAKRKRRPRRAIPVPPPYPAARPADLRLQLGGRTFC